MASIHPCSVVECQIIGALLLVRISYSVPEECMAVVDANKGLLLLISHAHAHTHTPQTRYEYHIIFIPERLLITSQELEECIGQRKIERNNWTRTTDELIETIEGHR
jgi:hypothetical protein